MYCATPGRKECNPAQTKSACFMDPSRGVKEEDVHYLEKGHDLNDAQDLEEEDAYDPKDASDLNGENVHDLLMNVQEGEDAHVL